jgi:rubredoxin
MATCPSCSINSRDGYNVMTVTPLDGEPTALVAWSVDGGWQMPQYRLRCNVCGWYIDGWIAGDTFHGIPASERRPPGPDWPEP